MNYKSICINCFVEKGVRNLCPVCGYTENNTDQPEATLYLSPRTILAGKYLTGKVLGQGGFGITYLGWDLNLGVKLAIKEFFPQGLVSRLPGQNKIVSLAGTEAQQLDYWLERFLKEARTLAQFEHHPNIVSVRDFFKEHDTAYMVMSYVEGLTLEQHLVREGGRLPFERASEIIMPVLDALREVHEVGFMHRDISPDNIFIDKRGRVVLIDFGAARQEIREKSKSLSVILKAGYAPEEQYRSRGKQGPWTDIYAAGATLYRCLTGQIPLEAMDRLAEDDLVPPSQLGAEIELQREAALLRALEVRAKERYQRVEEFQEALISGEEEEDIEKSYVKACSTKLNAQYKEPEQRQSGPAAENLMDAADIAHVKDKNTTAVKMTFAVVIVFILAGLLVFGGFNFLFREAEKVAVGETGEVEKEDIEKAEQPETGNDVPISERIEELYAPDTVEVIYGADYMIDYENGDILLSDVPIGSKVVDPTWEWEYRLGLNYSDSDYEGPTNPGEVKPVTWIVVSKDHYDGLETHVTMLSEELIGKLFFDTSTHVSYRGYNHWGESGTHATADNGLRPWLNSSGIHSGDGFYRAFSESFKKAVLTTDVSNREWKSGIAYKTKDRVFIPSTTELGDSEHNRTYRIGEAYTYFLGAANVERVARIGEHTWWYWTRSPDSDSGEKVHFVIHDGSFFYGRPGLSGGGVRPALNLKSETLVSEIRN